MAAILLHPGEIRIPALEDLESFRRWTRSEDFPVRGRIDWIEGELDVDMTPEDVTTHGTPKGAVAIGVGRVVVEERRGLVLIDSSRLTCPESDLSSEPDVLVVLKESLESGRVRLIPKAGGAEDRFVEVQGAADLVVECVSDSSEAKDTKKLPPKYFAAGVREYGLIDARREKVVFRMFRRGRGGFEAVARDRTGYLPSAVLGVAVRLAWWELVPGVRTFQLETRTR